MGKCVPDCKTKYVRRESKGSPSFFLLRFQSQNLHGYDTFLSRIDILWIFKKKMRVLSGISIIPKHPQKNNWIVSFPLRTIRQLSVMPTNFGNPTKSPKCALFCFIEGISIILKIQQVKFLQIEGRFVRTPHEQFKWKSIFFNFWMPKCFKLQSWDLICFEGTWFEMWSTQKLTF